MNYRILLRLLSLILGALALAFAMCLALALYYDDPEHAGRAVSGFLLAMTVAVVGSLGCWFAGRNADPRFFRKEALCVIGVGWILACLIGSIPYIVVLPGIPVADAVFESTSGITTTGASVLSNLEELPRSLLFWRALSQWVGGMGVVVFFVAILGFLGAGGKILFTGESTGRAADMDQARVQKGVLHIFYLYVALSLACFGAMRLCGLDWFDALCHMFTTVATGGFSTRTASIAAFANPALEWTMIVFMILGGTSFFFFLLLLRRNWAAAKRTTEVFAYFGIIIFSVILFTVFLQVEQASNDLHQTFRGAAFQVVSIVTTSGFVTADYDGWPLFSRMALLCMMVVGGCSASTAGGMKIVRLVVIFRLAVVSIERSFRTHVIRPVMINHRPLDASTQEGILTYVALLVLILLGAIPFLAFFESGHSLEGAVSAVTSTFFNIGPGFGEFGPTENFSTLTAPSKFFLSLLMLMGRLELYAVLVLFAPSLWKKFS